MYKGAQSVDIRSGMWDCPCVDVGGAEEKGGVLTVEEEDSVSRSLVELLSADYGEVPRILNYVLERKAWSLVKREHLERVVGCTRRVGGPCLDFLLAMVTEVPGAVEALRNREFFDVVKECGLDERMCRLLDVVMSEPQLVAVHVFGSGCFELFVGVLKRGQDFVCESASMIRRVASCSLPKDIVEGVVRVVFDLLRDMVFDEGEPWDAAASLLEALASLQKQVRLQSLVTLELIIEVINAFVSLPHRMCVVSSLNVLRGLSTDGDRALRCMIDAGTICYAKAALESKDDYVVRSALGFFKAWCLTSESCLGYLFDQISKVDFVSVCENTQFETKALMIDVLLCLCEKAKPVYILRLVSSEFVDAFVQQIDCFPDNTRELAFRTLAQACLRCSANPDFIRMVRATLMDTSCAGECIALIQNLDV